MDGLSLKGRWTFSQGQEKKHLEAELERMLILLKTCWRHTPLLKGCIKQDTAAVTDNP